MKKVIDLTTELYDGAPSMPMDPKCSVREHCNADKHGYNLSCLSVSTHQGTHLDAPYHFYNAGTTVDKIDPAKCIVRAFKIDLTSKQAMQPIEVADIEKYLPQIDSGRGILLHTGWDKENRNPLFFSEFPFISVELANFFAAMKVPLVGMDMPSPNGTDEKLVHEILLGAGCIIVEGLSNLEGLGNDEFTFIALPLKIRGGDGSPIRAVAMLD